MKTENGFKGVSLRIFAVTVDSVDILVTLLIAIALLLSVWLIWRK
jgi:hypothetical protein